MDNGETVNPIFGSYEDHQDCGLTKREYFAAMAMSSISKETIRWSTESENPEGEKHKNLMDHVARNAVYLADALIKELDTDKDKSL